MNIKYRISVLLATSFVLGVYLFNYYAAYNSPKAIKTITLKQPAPNVLPAATAPASISTISSSNSNDLFVVVQHGYRQLEYFSKNPRDGSETRLPISNAFYVGDLFASQLGLFFNYSDEASNAKYENDKEFYRLMDKDHHFSTIKSNIRKYNVDFILEAPDQSIVVLSIRNRVLSVEKILYENKQLATRFFKIDLPDSRNYGQAVILQDGRLMLIGGSVSRDAQELKKILNTTLFVDLNTEKWAKGPNLLEKRMEMTATLLPNGNVFVTGGYGKVTKVGHEANVSFADEHTSTEIFEVNENRFSNGPPMLQSAKNHTAKWVGGYEGRYLLAAGGTGNVMQYFDVKNSCWHFLRALKPRESFLQSAKLDNSQVQLRFSEFKDGNIAFTSQKVNLAKGCDDSPFELYTSKEIELNLDSFKFIAAKKSAEPNYILGGTVNTQFSSQAKINVSRLIWADGRSQTMPKINPLKTPDADRLPTPNFPRENNPQNSTDKVSVVELRDGRIIMHGGVVYPQKVAVLAEPSNTSIQLEKYVGIGQHKQADFYEIFDPKTGKWAMSAKSEKPEWMYAVFDDGAVFNISQPIDDWIKLEPNEIKNKFRDTRIVYHESAMEMSNSAGTVWKKFPYKPHVAIDESGWKYTAKPFVIQNELFLAGVRVISADDLGFRKYSRLLEWFDAKNKQWRVVWERQEKPYQFAGKQWDDLSSTMVFTSLPNGKKMLLPAYGVNE